MSNFRKRRISVSTKMGLAIIVVVAIVALAFYYPDRITIETGIEGVETIEIPDIFGGGVGDGGDEGGEAEGEKLTFTIVSDRNFLEDKLEFQNVSVTMKGTHTTDTYVGDVIFESAGKDLEVFFGEFRGSVVSEEDVLSVKGTATGAMLDSTKVKPMSSSFSVQAELKPTKYSIGPIDLNRLELIGVSGSIEKLGKESSITQLSDSAIDISGFQGTMVFEGGSYKLTGSASRVRGESFTLGS